MSGGVDPDFGPLRAVVPDAVAAGFAYVGLVADVRVYRNLDNGRELALDPRGVAHDVLGGAYWPVPRVAALHYALGETDRRPMPGRDG